jgi:D-alanyl-D-alanine carboxypeptidase
MLRWSLVGLALLVSATLACCGGSPGSSTGSSAAPSFSVSTIRQMESIVQEEMAEHGTKGVIVGVWIPGQGEWVWAAGLGNTSTGAAMGVADKVRIASITKSFTATVVLQLIEEGRLSFDTRLSSFAPYVPLADSITIRQLLGHLSGLFTYTADDTFTSTLLAAPTTVWTPRQLVDLAIAHPAYCAPGAGYNYSNTNYVLLGLIIEQLTGNTVESEIERRIFAPLGMTASSFPRTGTCAMTAPYSHGYWPLQTGGFLDITEIEPSSHWTSGAIVSNVYDLHTWVQALATGRLLSPAMQSERLTWHDTTDPTSKYGLGILKYGQFLGHDGTLPGFDSAMYYLPARGATFVVLANTVGVGHAPKDIFNRLVTLLIPDAVVS